MLHPLDITLYDIVFSAGTAAVVVTQHLAHYLVLDGRQLVQDEQGVASSQDVQDQVNMDPHLGICQWAFHFIASSSVFSIPSLTVIKIRKELKWLLP